MKNRIGHHLLIFLISILCLSFVSLTTDEDPIASKEIEGKWKNEAGSTYNFDPIGTFKVTLSGLIIQRGNWELTGDGILDLEINEVMGEMISEISVIFEVKIIDEQTIQLDSKDQETITLVMID